MIIPEKNKRKIVITDQVIDQFRSFVIKYPLTTENTLNLFDTLNYKCNLIAKLLKNSAGNNNKY